MNLFNGVYHPYNDVDNNAMTSANIGSIINDQIQKLSDRILGMLPAGSAKVNNVAIITNDFTLMAAGILAFAKYEISYVNCCFFNSGVNAIDYFNNDIELLIVEKSIEINISNFENKIVEIDKAGIIQNESTFVLPLNTLKNIPFLLKINEFKDYGSWLKSRFQLVSGSITAVSIDGNAAEITKKILPLIMSGSNINFIEFIKVDDSITENVKFQKPQLLCLSSSVLKQYLNHFNLIDEVSSDYILTFYDTIYTVSKKQIERLSKINPQFIEIVVLFGYMVQGLPNCYKSISSIADNFAQQIIGKSVFSAQNFILDNKLKFIPPDIIGALFIEADSLTQAKDIQQAFIGNRQFSLQKTNYNASYNTEKVIQLAGYRHEEIFIEGEPINIGQLEFDLINCAATSLKECKIIRKSADGHERLICFYVTNTYKGRQAILAEIKDALPATIFSRLKLLELPNMPLTENGDISIAALKQINVIEKDALEAIENAASTTKDIDGYKIFNKVAIDEQPKLTGVVLNSVFKKRHQTDDGKVNEVISDLPDIKGTNPAIVHGDMPTKQIGENDSLVCTLLQSLKQYPINGITNVNENGVKTFQSYNDIFEQSLKILNGFLLAGLKKGDRVILQVDANDFFHVFWACIAGGIVPLVIGPISFYTPNNASANKLYNAWQSLKQPVIIVSDKLQNALYQFAESFGINDLKVLNLTNIVSKEKAIVPEILPSGEAFMLLTSGSTGIPKCIPLSHRGALSHIFGMEQHIGINANDVIINILPIDHITPLLTLHIRAMIMGANQIQLSTSAFINDPFVWFDTIEKFKGTHTFSPNFAYKLILDRLNGVGQYQPKWDLSSLQYFKNGGELINYTIASAFIEKIKEFGVAAHKFQPAYGMTEAAGAITLSRVLDEEMVFHLKRGTLSGIPVQTTYDDPERVTFMSVGKPIPGVSIRITDDNNNVVNEGVVGKIQVKGTTVTKGYINNEGANTENFFDGWFNTGDYGFLKNGNLVVTGRKKDVIIINGVNYYALEFEYVVKQLDFVDEEYVVAIAVQDPLAGTESLAVFFTPVSNNEGIIKKVQKDIGINIATGFGVDPAYVIPVKRNDFPRTESGKINRNELFNRLQAGEFDDLITASKEKAGTVNIEVFENKVFRKSKGIVADCKITDINKFNISRLHPLSFNNKNNQLLLKINAIYIVFSDDSALAKELCRKLENYSLLFIVKPGSDELINLSIKSPSVNKQIDTTASGFETIIKEAETKYSQTVAGIFDVPNPNIKSAGTLTDNLVAGRHDNIFFTILTITNYSGDYPVPYFFNANLKRNVTIITRQNELEINQDIINSIFLCLINTKNGVIYCGQSDGLLDRYTENQYKNEECHVFYTSKENGILSNLHKIFPDQKSQLFVHQVSEIPESVKDADALLKAISKNESSETISIKTDIELKLTTIWESVLNKKGIAANDNFFELGGNSLKAIQIISRVYKELSAVIDFKDIFSYPTITTLAVAISLSYKNVYQSIKPVEKRAYYDLSHSQKRLWILNEKEENHIAYNMPMGFYLYGTLNLDLLDKAFKTLVNRHETLRTVFIKIFGNPKQKIVEYDKRFNLKRIDLRHDPERETTAAKIANEQFTSVFNLENGPLLKGAIVCLEEEKYLLLLTMHHIISDGWSLKVFFDELIVLYNAYLKNEEQPLPTLNIQYKDYSAWYNDLLNSAEINIHRNYWLKKLGSKTFGLTLPVDKSDGQCRSYAGRTQSFILKEKLAEVVKEFTAKHEVTSFILVQGIIKILFSKYSGQKEITIGAPIAGRGHKDLESQIGFYLNNIVLLDEVNDNDSFITFLLNVKQTNIEAYSHQLYPYDKLVEDMYANLIKGKNPFYDVMIVMETEGIYLSDGPLLKDTFTAIKSEVFKLNYAISKLDLTFFFRLEEDASFDIEYRTDLFRSKTIEKIAADFQSLLSAAIEVPLTTVAQLKNLLVTSEEKQEHSQFKELLSETINEDF